MGIEAIAGKWRILQAKCLRKLTPRTDDEDLRRQGFLFNVLIAGAIGLSLITIADAVLHQGRVVMGNAGSAIVGTTLLFVSCVILALSRLRSYREASMGLLLMCLAAGTYALFRWRIDLPTGLLLYALAICAAGALVSARAAATIAALVLVCLAALGALQSSGIYVPDTLWLADRLEIVDATVFAGIMGVMAFVTWFTNREIASSLVRARQSEEALRKQRDQLEVMVRQRTRMLEETQSKRLAEIQRFAEFGKITAGLLHDLANPLTAASLNLEQIETDHGVVGRVQRCIKHAERYLEGARRQLQDGGQRRWFSVRSEITRTLSVLEPKASGCRVDLRMDDRGVGRIYGDPVRFSQACANLVANAIDAAKAVSPHRGLVTVRSYANGRTATIAVEDDGPGISPQDVPRMFQAFYSTKGSNTGMGLGLSTVKDIVEKEFRGEVSVAALPGGGTVFQISAPVISEAHQADDEAHDQKGDKFMSHVHQGQRTGAALKGVVRDKP